jgi:hypothetical protein
VENTPPKSRLRAIAPFNPAKTCAKCRSSRRHGHQISKPNDIEHPAEIIGEGGVVAWIDERVARLPSPI